MLTSGVLEKYKCKDGKYVFIVVVQVVGLGNPGMNSSRHSVGMAVLEALASRLGVADSWRGDRHVSGEVIVSDIQDTQIVLLRPRLLMNINGVSVAKAGEDSCVFLMSFDVL